MFTETASDTTSESTSFAADTAPSTSKFQLSLAQRMALGSQLTELREKKGLSQLEVAQQALGFTVSHAAVSRLERGVFGVVDNVKLDKLAAFYDTTVEKLLVEMEGRREEEEPEEYRATENLTVQPGVDRRLYNLRQAMDLTKLEMAQRLGHLHVNQWHAWESGKATPRPDTLLDIAINCGVSAAWLITGKRAKPQAPVFSMRLRAMQKLYDLDNREVSLLSDMDLEYGRSTVARLTRTRKQPSYEMLHAVASALDVPTEWICPPEVGYTTPDKAEAAPTPEASHIPTKPKTKGEQFLDELKELFESGVLKDEDVRKLRKTFMQDLMKAARNAG